MSKFHCFVVVIRMPSPSHQTDHPPFCLTYVFVLGVGVQSYTLTYDGHWGKKITSIQDSKWQRQFKFFGV